MDPFHPFSDTEVNQAANAFEAYLDAHKINQREKILIFSDGFLEGWRGAKNSNPPMHIGAVCRQLDSLSENVISDDKDIRTFGVCLGILVGIFQFQQREVLKNSHIYLGCIAFLYQKPQKPEYKEEYGALFEMMRRVVKVWKAHIEGILHELGDGEIREFDEFKRNEHP